MISFGPASRTVAVEAVCATNVEGCSAGLSCADVTAPEASTSTTANTAAQRAGSFIGHLPRRTVVYHIPPAVNGARFMPNSVRQIQAERTTAGVVLDQCHVAAAGRGGVPSLVLPARGMRGAETVETCISVCGANGSRVIVAAQLGGAKSRCRLALIPPRDH